MHSVFFFSVGEFWDSFGQRGQGLEPLDDHLAKLGLQFKTVEAVSKILPAFGFDVSRN